MANVTSKLYPKDPATALMAMLRALIAGFGRCARWLEPPDKYRPERRYMRGTGPKSRAKREGHSRPL